MAAELLAAEPEPAPTESVGTLAAAAFEVGDLVKVYWPEPGHVSAQQLAFTKIAEEAASVRTAAATTAMEKQKPASAKTQDELLDIKWNSMCTNDVLCPRKVREMREYFMKVIEPRWLRGAIKSKWTKRW